LKGPKVSTGTWSALALFARWAKAKSNVGGFDFRRFYDPWSQERCDGKDKDAKQDWSRLGEKHWEVVIKKEKIFNLLVFDK